jgi:serine/threonine-protein kinase
VTQAELLDRLRVALASQYAIDREIGRGGMATVYLAKDLKHRRPVALKVLHTELAESLGPERFRREITFAAQLQHPHILTVLDSGETADGLLWFTMPFVEGESLRARLRRERQLSSEDATRITREVAQALDSAHRHGVIHRDIKPENILLTTDGQALVADFGIARGLRTQTGEHPITGTGIAIGTPGYMSPEQASGDSHLDARADVYGLAAVCYEMLVGEPPFTGATSQAILAKVLSGEVPSVRRTRPAAPVGVDAAIQKALSPVPADRFATPGQFAQALEAAERASVTGAVTPPEHPAAPLPGTRAAGASSRRPFPAGAALLGLGFVIGVGVLFAWRSHNVAGSSSSGPVRVAVLPFENIGDTSDAYFADGLTEAVRGKLTTVPGLAVVASSSSRQYRHTDKTPQQIAEELGGVRYLLMGTVRWAKAPGGASRVMVNPSLVDVSTGTDAWQQPFDAPFKDVFAVQGDIADRVVQALGVALNSGARQTLTERPTGNPEAYDAYLKGEAMGALAGANVSRLNAAVQFYQQAIALDSGFGPAWARLAQAEAHAFFNGSPTPERESVARKGVERARALDPHDPDTYLAAGSYDAFIRVDNNRALTEFTAGLAVAPSNADLLTAAALVEQGLGRWDAALTHLQQAQSLDPRNVLTARRLASTYLWLHRFAEAAATVDRGLTLSPTSVELIQVRAMVPLAQGDLAGARVVITKAWPIADSTTLAMQMGNYWDLYWVLDDAQQRYLLSLPVAAFGDRAPWATVRAETYAVRGDQARARVYADSAREAFEAVVRATPEDAQSHAELGLVLAILGRKADAVREAQRAVAIGPIAQDGYSGPYYEHLLARTYVLVAEPDKAIEALAPLTHTPYWLTPALLKIDPSFAPLRNNPKFQALVGSS